MQCCRLGEPAVYLVLVRGLCQGPVQRGSVQAGGPADVLADSTRLLSRELGQSVPEGAVLPFIRQQSTLPPGLFVLAGAEGGWVSTLPRSHLSLPRFGGLGNARNQRPGHFCTGLQ